jgi:phosphonate transport system substrate-binding protein
MYNRRFFLQQIPLFVTSLTTAKFLSSCQVGSNSNSRNAKPSELKFGILSTESQENQAPLWQPFLKAFAEAIKIPVTGFYTNQYSRLIEAMRFGEIQVAWLGGKAYIEAAQVADAEAFALTIATDGAKGYYAHLITHRDNPFVAEAKAMGGDQYVLKNGKNLTFAFNDPDSTSGFLVPNYYIFSKNSVNPNQLFKLIVFAGSHEATALAVAKKEVDIATNNSEALVRLEKNNPQAFEQIEIIWTSVLIPGDPIAYRRDLPEDLKQKIQQFFYNYQDQAVLNPLEWSGFEPATDQVWNPIRELKIGEQIIEIESNDRITPEEKEKIIEELRKKLLNLQN